MASVRFVLRQIPDPRGRKGRRHPLEALLGLIVLSMLTGRRGMAAAHRLGRSLTPRQLRSLGFRPRCLSPSHPTLTELLRALDAGAMEQAFGRFTLPPSPASKTARRRPALDARTLRGGNDEDGPAVRTLLAFRAALELCLDDAPGGGLRTLDALRLLTKTELTEKP